MNISYIQTADYLEDTLKQSNIYFIVEKDIILPNEKYKLGKGSVIEFVGGSFTGKTGTSLDLNGGQVIAAPYTIFKNLNVYGFGNDKVYADWFFEGSFLLVHKYINKALIAAQGCPVVLAHKEYTLRGTIVFPNTTPSTLIVYGSFIIDDEIGEIAWQNNPVAIDIDTSNVSIDINRIKYTGKEVPVLDEDGNQVYDIDEKPLTKIVYKGTGIRISGEVSDVSVNVNTILDPERGIDISPGRADASANMDYLKIRFQTIQAVYGIYIDIFSHGDPEKNWLKRSTFHGGRIKGDYGLYIDDTNCPANFSNDHINEILFSNIGFEGIEEQSIHLRKATHLKFEFIRMAESQPKEDYWIDLKDVSFVSFTINGGLRLDKYNANGICDNIIIKGAVLQDTKWTGTPFDAIVIDTLQIQRGVFTYPFLLKAATCTVNPYQMTRLINSDEGKDKDNTLKLQEIQPYIIKADGDEYEGLSVLPRMLEFKINKTITIELKGLAGYMPCIYYISLDITAEKNDNSIGLALTNSDGAITTQYIDGTIPTTPDNYVKLKESGLYQLVWIPYLNQKKDSEIIKAKWATYVRKISGYKATTK